MIDRKKYILYHRYFKRDILGKLALHQFGCVGDSTIIFKPIITDRNKQYIKIGRNVTIGKYARINCYPNNHKEDYLKTEANLSNGVGEAGKIDIPEITIGDDCNIGQRLSLLAGGKINIGRGVLMASDILVTSENHSINPEEELLYMDQPLICANVNIKDGCWIGEKVIIMPGVTIGRKSVIGAGSIVTHDIPDYCIAVGNPAQVIKKYNFTSHKWEIKR